MDGVDVEAHHIAGFGRNRYRIFQAEAVSWQVRGAGVTVARTTYVFQCSLFVGAVLEADLAVVGIGII